MVAGEPRVVEYEPAGIVVKEFLESNDFVRGIMGPIGSGKSTGCVIDILKRSMEQWPSPDGIRRTRWAVIRNSYPELKSTTIKTWGEWCPTTYGRLNQDSPITHHIKTPDIDLEVLFMALDRDDDVRKLLSLELTGAWINEAREVPKAIVDALTGRVGRYPSRLQGGCRWSGIIMDTNPPDDQAWWYKLCEEDRPEGWKFFKQPSGDNLNAENIKNLPKDYYKRIKAGKDPDWIKVYVGGEYGFVTEGKAVYPMFRDRVHTNPGPLEPVEGVSLLIGADFGLTPAAIIAQKLVDGRWLILDEFVADSCGIIRFAELLRSYLAKHYPNHRVEAGWGDPAGNQRAHSDERTALEIMKEHSGWKNWKAAPSNDPTMRREVVVAALNRMVDGHPGILISPKAAILRKGFSGGYHFKFIKSGNGTQLHETPNKNQFSHPHDALQYLLLGGGEHRVVMNRSPNQRGSRPTMAHGIDYNVLG
jgi:hypothetical protein